MLRISPRPHRDTLFMGGSLGATFPQFIEKLILIIGSLIKRPPSSSRGNPMSIHLSRIRSAPGSGEVIALHVQSLGLGQHDAKAMSDIEMLGRIDPQNAESHGKTFGARAGQQVNENSRT